MKKDNVVLLPKKHSLWREILKHKSIYLIFAPTLLFYLIFMYIPMFGTIIAFQDYSIRLGVFDSKWVGLENFLDFLSNPKFFELLRNTLVISSLSLVIGFPLPIVLALLLNELSNLRFKKFVQTVTYMPHFISTVVMVGILTTFLSTDGVINGVRAALGLPAVQFMTTPEYFPWIYVLSNIWQNIGWSSIIYISAIAGVDQELYEAARIDGANRWKQMLYVTLPGIASTMLVLFIMQVGNILSVGHEKILLMYNSATYETADVISTYVYRKGLLESDYGYSAAVGIFNSVCNFTMLMLSNAISKKVSGQGLW